MTSIQPSTPVEEAGASQISVERWTVSSSSERDSRASLVLYGGGWHWRAHATGNGAVDALMRAVDEALASLLGNGLQLTTYDVHATGEGHDTTAEVTVSLRPRDGETAPIYPGRATHENVLEASLSAYVDAINGYLADRAIDVASRIPSPGATDRHDAAPDHEVRSRTVNAISRLYNG
ncbi:MAG TPA: alpha-isopropylmalate synthase regulatory domain-containing protein [Candidatus Binatia bacterium]|nr:alpha-isopropylmalate synthase regulatory domain-containing protein [Candidatus Binatia bacterium]